MNTDNKNEQPVFRWVKAEERRPDKFGTDGPIFREIETKNVLGYAEPPDFTWGEHTSLSFKNSPFEYFVESQDGLPVYYHEQIEWLEEIPAKEEHTPEKPVGIGKKKALTYAAVEELKDRYGHIPIPEQPVGEIPKMTDELAALSDFAAIEYGKLCDRFIGSQPYDSGHIAEAHEQGQGWMYRKLQPEIEALKEKADRTGEISIEWYKEKKRADEFQESKIRLDEWRADAKRDAGYDNNVSFDTVWKDALHTLKSIAAITAERDELKNALFVAHHGFPSSKEDTTK